MSSFQKTIKYIAIGFAVFLAISIITGIANVAVAIITAISGGVDYVNEETINYSDTFTEVKSLKIDNSTGKLTIKTGDTFKIEAEDVSKNFEAKVESDGTLVISENSGNNEFFWFRFNINDNPNSKITVYLPADFVAEEAKIETGAGTVSLEGLKAKYLLISAGAGNTSGSSITAGKVKIDGGVGNVSLNHIDFTDADFDCGVGNLEVDGILQGASKVNCGVGDVKLDLIGDVDEYDLEVDSGIGSIRLNGEKLKNEFKSDKGARNSIKIDGGIGNVKINIGESLLR